MLLATFVFSLPATATDYDDITKAMDGFIEGFRRTGARPPDKLKAIEADVEAALRGAEGIERARLLHARGNLQRMQNRFVEAADSHREAAEAASEDVDLAFDAWIGVARAHFIGTNDHGAAAMALESARDAAGPAPSRERQAKLADFSSQMEAARNDLHAALASGLQLRRLAESDEEHYYAHHNIASVLVSLAKQCDSRPLHDQLSVDDTDPWEACRRAIYSARRHHDQAAEAAGRRGWTFLVQLTQQMSADLDSRLFLIDQKAEWSRMMNEGSPFDAESSDQVWFDKTFGGNAMQLPDADQMADVLAEVITFAEREGNDDAGTSYLRGIRDEILGRSEEALTHFYRSVEMLLEERQSFFDLRQRGMAIEKAPEYAVTLGSRLLARSGEIGTNGPELPLYQGPVAPAARPALERAFDVFEAVRAWGLGMLATGFGREQFSDDERWILAELMHLQSVESAKLTQLVEATITGQEERVADRLLDEIEGARVALAARAREVDVERILARLAAVDQPAVTLPELEARVREGETAVLLYWVTPTCVVIWAVLPGVTEVRCVFFPKETLNAKVSQLRETVEDPNRPFNAAVARQLYTYLIAPIAPRLGDTSEIIIVPQGQLVALPFETLIDPRTGYFLAETNAVSYAPNATFAAEAISRDQGALPPVTVVYDSHLAETSGEVQRLAVTLTNEIKQIPVNGRSKLEAIKALGSREALHVLMHGVHDAEDPLLSYIFFSDSAEGGAAQITAAELLAVDFSDTRLVVFSSCESGALSVRISNEVYGLSWPPLIGGADAVVMARWEVDKLRHADWMDRFYRNLAETGTSPSRAAAAAMRTMIEAGHKHPYYWAGPQIFGS